MYFNTLPFVIFFVAVCVLFFIVPQKFRWFLLLAASIFFYTYTVPSFLIVLGISILINYAVGIAMDGKEDSPRKSLFIIGIILNVALLCFFKYLYLLGTNITGMFSSFEQTNTFDKSIYFLPIGLSFHTFQGISYLAEVYKKNFRAENHIGIFSLYILFFPQVMAGPIEKPQDLLKQFYEDKKLEYNRISAGLRMVLWGLFKKMVIADRVSVYVNAVYGNPQRMSSITILIGTLFFIVQIYCDFSGYVDIARGTAKVLGFELGENFNRPFFGKGVVDKIMRWHISLYKWFKEYIFTPITESLTGKSFAGMLAAVVIVFVISGLWHGIKSTYLIWGLLTAAAVVVEQIFTRVVKPQKFLNKKLLNLIGWGLSTLLLIPACVFFRALSTGDAMFILQKLIHLKPANVFKGEPPLAFYYGFFGVFFLLITEFIQEYIPALKIINSRFMVVRFASYLILVLLILMIGVFDKTQFIYFQF